MASSLLGVARLLTVALTTWTPAGPVDWSRDGRWIAWTAVESTDAPALPPGWLLSPRGAVPPATARRTYRVRVTRFPSLESVLIRESTDPVSSPCWSADGRTLAYARFVAADPAADGVQRGRFEVVVRSGLDRERVVTIDPALELDADARESLATTRPALSPDGRRAAVARPGTAAGLWLASLEDSGAIATLDGAVMPAWSPDGRRLAYLKPRPGPNGVTEVALHVTAPGAAAERPLIADGSLTPDFLAWAPDGQSLLLIVAPMRGALRGVQRDLARIGLDGSLMGRASTLEAVPSNIDARRLRPGVAIPSEPPPTLRLELTLDELREECVCLVETNSGRDQVFRWGNARTQNTFKRFHPLDPGMRIGAPALAPDGRTTAFRVEDGTAAGLLALIDLESEELSLIAPDEATRRRWVDRLAACALSHLLEWLPQGTETPARPTVLPVLAELGGLHPRRYVLSRLARFATPLLGEPSGGERDGLDEFRLFFSYLNQDFDSASRWLGAVEAATDDPEARLRWLGLRAQILLGAGRDGEANGILDYLARETRSTTLSIEETAGRYAIATEPSRHSGWVEHLRKVSSDAAARRSILGGDGLSDEDQPPSHLDDWDRDPPPNVPFAPLPGDGPGGAPIVPDEFNPPGLRLRVPLLGPVPDAPPPAPMLPPFGGLRLEFEE